MATILLTDEGAPSVGKDKLIEEQIKFLNQVNAVEGFNPLLFGYQNVVNVLGERQEQLQLPVKTQVTWFRLKYPNGRIVRETIEKTDDICTAECKIYIDDSDCFIGQGRTTVKYDPSNSEINLESAAWTYATGKALKDAGFGLQFGFETKYYKSFEGLDDEKFNQTELSTEQEISSQSTTNSFVPTTNTEVKEKELEKKSVLDIMEQKAETVNSDFEVWDAKIEALTKKALMSETDAAKVPCTFEKYVGKTMGDLAKESPKILSWFLLPTTISRFENGVEMAQAAYQLAKNSEQWGAVIRKIS